MLKHFKKGFSLVEVMILFTILAVVAAAAMPLITKKSKAIPKKSAHGVYICINNGNGTFTEEYYSAFRLLNSNPEAGSCSFSAPKANDFKVILYGAGAGGVKLGSYTAAQNDDRTYDFTSNDAVNYANSGNLENILKNVRLSFVPTNEQFTSLLAGLQGTVTNFTGNAGNGGKGTISYRTVPGRCYNSGNASNGTFMPYYGDGGSDTRESIAYANGDGQGIYVYNKDFQNQNIMNQYTDWCKLKFPGTSGEHADGDYADISQDGGQGGSGKFLVLRYNFLDNVGNSQIYRSSDSSYPFLRYWADIANNHSGRGFLRASCEGSINNNVATLIQNRCTDNASPAKGDDGEDKKCDSVNSPTDEPFTKESGVYHYCEGEDGNSPDRIAAFSVYDFGAELARGLHNRTHVTNQSSFATGGSGGKVTYQTGTGDDFTVHEYTPATTDEERADLSRYSYNCAHRVFKGTASDNKYSDTSDDGNNAESHETTSNVYYSLENASDNDISSSPFINLNSNLWSKSYIVGKPGSMGQTSTFNVQTLGTNCTISVKPGGPVIEAQNLSLAEIQERKNTYESNLNTSMVCRDKENRIVFDHTVAGGKYDTTMYTDTYNWNRDNEENGKKIDPGTPALPQYYSSLWSQVFRRITSLTDKKVAQGGQGTVITDNCTVPRGTWSMKAFMTNQNQAIPGRSQGDEHDGFLNGVQCYRNSATLSDMQNDGLYDIINSDEQNGGPGAVIITW